MQEDPAPQSRAGGRRVNVAPSLRSGVADYALHDALGEGAPPGSAAYLQLLLQVLGDGALSVGEGEALRACAREYRLSADDLQAVHRGLLVAVARQAIEDDVVARGEREELRQVARMLDLPDATVSAALNDARERRQAALSEDLPPLPDDWALGEPLRVGDRIAITGCEAFGRSALEERTRARGVIVTGGVSSKYCPTGV